MLFFEKILRRFFIGLDSVLFNFISTLYDLLIDISRTSILSQGEIARLAQRIELLLGIFMLFKLSFSLITYIVNPDDFSDKSKGFGKLIQNAIISLLMLVLVPYAFQMAFNLQTKILEGNVLAKLIMGEDTGGESYLNTAGDEMAFDVMVPFFLPNTGLKTYDLSDCVTLYDSDGKFSQKCQDALEEALTSKDSGNVTLENYITGINERSLGLTFRSAIGISQPVDSNSEEETGDEFIIDYKLLISTVVAVVVCLLLVTFCIDIGVRSVKLAFLQLIYPIPVISYMDPKSGKDGLFKKWYKMCFSTFLSLFVRLLALYFGIYIIYRVGQFGMYDVITGAQKTGFWLQVFIIIGVLMFVKQLPKILENMGIKLDGDGKFTLNPLKKLEEGAVGGKRITGAAAGLAIGALGNKGNPFRAVGGMFRGAAGNKGLSSTAKHQADVNRKLRQAKLDGSTFGGRMNARWTNFSGAKGFNNVERDRKKIEALKATSDAMVAMENRAVDKIKSGEAGNLSKEYLARENRLKAMQEAYAEGKKFFTDSTGNTYQLNEETIAYHQMKTNEFLNNEAKYAYMDAMLSAKSDKVKPTVTYTDSSGAQVTDKLDYDYTFKSKESEWRSKSSGVKEAETPNTAKGIHKELGRQKGRITELDNETRDHSTANKANQDYVEAAKWK